MTDVREILREAAIQIRDERRLGANTANRVGSLLLALVDAGANIEQLEEFFIRKDQDDTALGLITFLKGIIAEALSKFLLGAEFGEYTGIDGTGAFIDEIGDAIFNKITTRSDLIIGGKLTATIIEALDKILTGDLLFSGNIQSKDYVSGLLGLGIRIGANGEIEAGSMKLRKGLIVPDLIFNRVRIVGNELWVTEGGDIESIVPDADSEDNLYWLKLKGVDANSPCPLWEDDIVRGIVKVKGANGQFGGFYTVEMRVIAIAPDQTFSAVPRYADKPPVQGLTIARTGNFTNRERMRSIYLSSDGGYIRFLDEVDGWDIERRMIKCQFGNMDGLTVEGLENLGGYNAYLDNVLARGAFVQVSQDGVTERPVVCFKGEWQAGKYYYYDEISYSGNRYLCIAKTTTQQPAYDSTDWLMTEGNAKFSVSIYSSNGYEFFAGNLNTTLNAIVYSGNEDITGSIPDSQVKWQRKSGDDASDTIWNTDHTADGISIQLTNEDIPSFQPDSIEFVCEVTVIYNDKVYKSSDSIFI